VAKEFLMIAVHQMAHFGDQAKCMSAFARAFPTRTIERSLAWEDQGKSQSSGGLSGFECIMNSE
jgi:hypothetical protein